MADNSNDNQNPDSGTSEGEELKLETIVELNPDELSDEQKTFLTDNAGELTDEQKEKFKIGVEGGEEEEDVDPEKVEIETRTPEDKTKKPEGDKDEEEDEEIDPEDKKNIGRVVDDKLNDFRDKLDDVQKVKDQQDVSDYIADNPEFKPYRGVMLKYLAHPAYKNIPVKSIAAIVASGDLQKLGAQKEREAARKAKETQGGGTTIRTPSKGETDWANVSSEEFQKKKNEVLGIK